MQYDDGDQYAGEWNDAGKREGFGVLTFADGKCQSALIYKYIYINISPEFIPSHIVCLVLWPVCTRLGC